MQRLYRSIFHQPQNGQTLWHRFSPGNYWRHGQAQTHLIDHLGIEKLLAVVGGSMGGMQVLQWMVAYPERIRSAIPIATTMKHTPQQIAFNEVGRQAIMADPDWKNGHYYGLVVPAKGLAVARMIGHITYMSDASMTEKFGRRFAKTRNHSNLAQNLRWKATYNIRATTLLSDLTPTRIFT